MRIKTVLQALSVNENNIDAEAIKKLYVCYRVFKRVGKAILSLLFKSSERERIKPK